jgi:aspartate carbamoyltransferase catalytic subunit
MENGSTNGVKTVGLAPNLSSGFYGQDVISVRQFTRENLTYIFDVADEMRAIVKRVGSSDLLKGHVLACVFYEPSTRTSSSFISAMSR